MHPSVLYLGVPESLGDVPNLTESAQSVGERVAFVLG